MDRVSIKEQAKASLKANYGIALGATLLYTVIIGVSGSVPLATLILAGPLTVGLYALLSSLYHNNTEVAFEEMFSGFKNFGSNLVAYLLYSVFIGLWGLLFVIPGIVKSYSYALTFFIMKDNPEMDGYDAIQKSRKMMNGHKWELFVLDLSFIGWYLLSILTFGLLAIFYVSPYHSIARAGFYEELARAEEQAASEDQTYTQY